MANNIYRQCIQCENEFTIGRNSSPNKFCSKSCAASYNNKHRIIKNRNTKTILCKKCKDPVTVDAHTNTILCNSCKATPNEFCKLFSNTCKHCKHKWLGQKRKYCNNCRNLYSDHGRVAFYFRFNIFDYPNLFDLNLIKKHGFFSNGKNGSKININGVSRDHKVSINDSIKYNYDPYYISHPMNCELLLHQDNNMKKANSSITYENLISLVNAYDKQYS